MEGKSRMPRTEPMQQLLTVAEPSDGFAILFPNPDDPDGRTAWDIGRYDGGPKDAALHLAKTAGWYFPGETEWALNEDAKRWEITIEIQNKVET
jgi:hypothetical protein